MAKLVVISEGMKGRTFELEDDKLTVGRLPDNQIRLEDNTVSSHHAKLIRKDDYYVVRDLNSTNGTRVNGQRIVETRLYHGDVVGFGHLQLQYFSADDHPPRPLPSPQKKTVDLGISPKNATRPTSYGSASPFAKHERNKSKVFLQVAAVILALIVVLLLAYAITKVLNV